MPRHSAPAEGLKHTLISASAGSGKTFQLTRRYLHLLTLGVEPTCIVAMTFTRKAAGEFFNRILDRLAQLAAQPAAAKRYFAGLSPRVPDHVDYAALLRRLTRQIPRLRLGTLDSFFTSIAACFPMETGLSASAVIMEEEATRQARMEVLDLLLDRLQNGGDEQSARLLLDAIKQASFSTEPKSLEDMLRQWVADLHALWMESRDKTVWGNAPLIWPDEDWQAGISTHDLISWAETMRQNFPRLTPSVSKDLDNLTESLSTLTPGTAAAKVVERFLERTAKYRAELARADGEIKWGHTKIQLNQDLAAAWLHLARGLCRREFLVRAERARGLAAFLAAYDDLYHQRVRAQGRLSFVDIPLLLGAAAQAASWPSEDVWFRLDGRFDHWMLDEFQDTSHNQWRVTERLVEEVLQDSSGRRSFFAVGDVKQSIYTWRHAEPEIFAGLSARKDIATDSLAVSYRSGPQVLAAVNQVFHDRAAIEALLPSCTRNWFFAEHHCGDNPPQGHAALLQMRKEEGEEKDTSEETGAEPGEESGQEDFLPSSRSIAALLRRLDPLQRGLSCAVITRQNNTTKQLADELRTLTGMSVVTEANIEPTQDNAPVLALLSLLQLAAHPNDRAALEHLRMTPLRPLVENESRRASSTALRIAQDVFARGFTAFALEWTKRLRALPVALGSFEQQRLAEFAGLCATYDESGSRDLDAFLQTARQHTLARPASASAIQVMTVHKSKGLEFDVVFVTDMGTKSMDYFHPKEWLTRKVDGQTKWVLQAPAKAFQTADPVLDQLREENRINAGFDSLCLLYVAMTRARRALYLLNPPAPKTSTSITPAAFLRDRLGAEPVASLDLDDLQLDVLWQEGEPDWFQQHAAQSRAQQQPPPASEPLRELVRQNQPGQRRRTPSGEEAFRVPGSVLFSPSRDTGRRLGSLAHELLAEVEWWTAGDAVEPLQQRWRQLGLLDADGEAGQQALDLVLPALNDPALAPAFARPTTAAQVWRERSFDFIDAGGWVSGVFDRVVLELDSTGAVTAACLIDFKTDDIPDAQALAEKTGGYAPQLALYQRAVARLTGLPPERVSCQLLFLRARRLVQV